MTPQSKRTDFAYFSPLQTRWADNDAYGHINNVVYYSYFDTVVNGFLIEKGLLEIQGSGAIGLVVETQCHYFAPLAFPQPLEGGLRVAKIGNSSVRYELGIFAKGEQTPAAEGHFVHVYVDRDTRRPALLPETFRETLAAVMGSAA